MKTSALVMLGFLAACGRFEPVEEQCYRKDAPWTRVAIDPDDHPVSVWGSGPNDVWAVGGLGLVMRWQGTAWKRIPKPTEHSLENVWGSGPNDVWAVGCSGTILHFDGTAWTLANSGTENWEWNQCFYGVGGSGPDDVWAVGNKNTLAHWDGATWKLFTAGTDTWFSVWSNGPNNMVAVGGKGELVHWNGVELRLEDSGSSADLQGVWGTGQTYWIAGEQDVLRRTNGGGKPEKISMKGLIVQNVWGTSASDLYATSTDGTVMHFDGTAWQESCGTGKPHDAQTAIGGIWSSPEGGAWAVGSNGFILHGP